MCLDRPYHFKFFKRCLPQFFFAPLLNNHIFYSILSTAHLTECSTAKWMTLITKTHQGTLSEIYDGQIKTIWRNYKY